MKVAYLFAQKRTGQPITSIEFVSSKDKETAKLLLAQLSFDEMAAFIDFALREASRTNFDVQTLGGIKSYIPSYLTARERQAASALREQAHHARKRAEAALEAEHAKKIATARRLFAALSSIDQQRIRLEAEAGDSPARENTLCLTPNTLCHTVSSGPKSKSSASTMALDDGRRRYSHKRRAVQGDSKNRANPSSFVGRIRTLGCGQRRETNHVRRQDC